MVTGRKTNHTPYQHVGNNGHSSCLDKSLQIYSPFLCHDFYRQHNSGLIYQQARRNTFSQLMCGSMENPPMVPKTSNYSQDSTYPRQIQCFGRQAIENRQSNQNRVGIGSIDSEFNLPNVQLSQSGSVCDTFQSQTSTLCLSSSGQSSFCNRCILHELGQSSCLCISSNNTDSSRPEQDTSVSVQNIAPLWPQQAWFSEVLQLLVSAPVHLPLCPNLLTQAKGKFQHQNLPALNLHAWELSSNQSEIKKFSQNVADFVSKSRQTSTQKVYDVKWTTYTRWYHRKKVNLVSAPLTVIANFLIYLFSEKKYQISTIKGYRFMISNTLKFKTSNRIGSDPVLSELIRSFELQCPVQRSVSPKWDLSWVLVCLQKAPYEPLHKASRLHVMLKTAFLLALATAKRCSEIHALAMVTNHLRFNQSDGSVSLIVQSGFLAKNQLPSICPDP